jgi:hypothetical protein
MRDDARVKARCPCGAEFAVDDHELTSEQSCPRCRALYHVVLKMDPRTRKKVAILVPKGPLAKEEKGKTRPPPPPPRPSTKAARPPAPKSADKFEAIFFEEASEAPPPMPGRDREADREKMAPSPATKPDSRRVRPLKKGDPVEEAQEPAAAPVPEAPCGGPPRPPPGAQAVACPCGAYVMVRRKDLDQTLPCMGCGRALRFIEDRDPQTLAPRIRIRPGPPNA